MLGSSPEIAGLISGTWIYLSARKDLPAGANLCAIFTISLSDHRTTSADSDVSLPSDPVLQKVLPPTCAQPPETPTLFLIFFSFSILRFPFALSAQTHTPFRIPLHLYQRISLSLLGLLYHVHRTFSISRFLHTRCISSDLTT